MRRVTEILSDYSDFSMVSADVLQAASERGTLVHDICAGILLGFFPPEIPDDVRGYIDSFLVFKEQYIKDIIAVEAEVIHPTWNYIGHIDFAGYLTMIPGEAVVLDWKTPVTKSKTWQAQAAAYREAARHSIQGHIWGPAGFLQLNAKGTAPTMTWVENPAEAFHAFICKLQADNYFRGR